jgi:hypothetical protein
MQLQNVTLNAAAKCGCGVVGSKRKTCVKQKIHMTEIVQAGFDCVTAQ